jgi:hypothetical protein
MKAAQLSALLGRPLTSVETDNLTLYVKIATETLEDMLCTSLCDQDDPKLYDVREGYSTVFTDIFTDIDEVKIDGDVIASSDYSVRQWDKRNARWYNSIVFDRRLTSRDKEVEVSASWGFSPMPSDLQAVLAGLFDLITKKNKLDPSVQSKQVEDFRVTLRADVDLDVEFYKKYGTTLRKYSMCDIGQIRHGKVHRGRYTDW